MAKDPRKPSKNDVLLNDQFLSIGQRVMNLLTPHAGRLALLGAFAIVVWIAAWGFAQFAAGRREAASEVLGQALRIYQAELLGDKDSAPAADETPRFKTAKERADAALAELDRLDREYGGSDAARRGLLLRGAILFDQQRYDDAEARYRKFLAQAGKDEALSATAREGIALSEEARGKIDEAIREYQQIQGDFYRDRALAGEARLYLKKGDKRKAIELYKEALSKAPQSPLHDDLSNRLTALEN